MQSEFLPQNCNACLSTMSKLCDSMPTKVQLITNVKQLEVVEDISQFSAS